MTMEPFAIANAKPILDLIEVSPNLPTNICASEDVERLVTLQEDVGAFLWNFLNDPAKPGWRISTGLAGLELSRNAVLDKAWKNYDWGPTKETLGE